MSTAERARLKTIGKVCSELQDEFSDISISKIRYLEDQQLLKPRRTQGGYRLYDDEDVDRLRTILRLQRDEFLPLRVIRQELAGSQTGATRRAPGKRRAAVQAASAMGEGAPLTREALLQQAGVDEAFLAELEEFGLVEGHYHGDTLAFEPSDADIVRIARQMANYGLAPRHLRPFQSAVQRAAGMLEGVLAPSLRSPNRDRRDQGLEDLVVLAQLAGDLTERLLVHDVGGDERRAAKSG